MKATFTIAHIVTLILFITIGVTESSYAQTANQPNRGTKKGRTELSRAVVAPVPLKEPRGHDPAMDMYNPKPGGVDATFGSKAKIVTDPNSKLARKQNKQLAREEHKEIRRQNREKTRKDKLAMGRSVSRKNADPSKVNRNAR